MTSSGTPGEVANEKAARVLVIEDNEANRALAKNALEDEGYVVLLAKGGVEGLEMFQREAPDCVLLDIRMPDLDGFAVCERIRKLSHGPETPVLFLTAQRDVDTFDRAQLAGGDDFLTKPLQVGELLTRVRSAIKLRRLSAEVGEHYVLLKQQRDALLRLQLQKERLTAFVVHDLKNPVNSIDLCAQLLLRERELPPSARESSLQIRADARQLNRMILNLLDLAKADEGQLSPRPSLVDLRKLVGDTIAELAVNAQAHGVDLRSELSADRIWADEDLLRRTLTNLVENAIRYAPRGTTILVTGLRTDEGTELRVADAGSGIPPAMRDKVFDPFVQVEAGDHPVARAGRGLGLTFCKLTVLAHGGLIWIEDATPGAVFCVRLPHGP
jgi:two-component system sensor histidine kinase/response regulator